MSLSIEKMIMFSDFSVMLGPDESSTGIYGLEGERGSRKMDDPSG